MTQEVIFMVGAPGAGKSTYAESYPHVVSSDALRKVCFGDESIQHPAVWGVVKSVLKAKIEYGFPTVVLDATMAKRRDRVGMINFVRGCISPGAKIICVYVQADKKTLLERRPNIPREAIDGMLAALKANPPSLEDGFDEIRTHDGLTR